MVITTTELGVDDTSIRADGVVVDDCILEGASAEAKFDDVMRVPALKNKMVVGMLAAMLDVMLRTKA